MRLLSFVCVLVCALAAPAAAREASAERADASRRADARPSNGALRRTPIAVNGEPRKELTGRLWRVDGLRVIELWGSDRDAGYARGWLLGDEIVALFDAYVLAPEMVDPEQYELLRKRLNVFRFTPRQQLELDALWAGMRDRVGREGLRSEKLDRAIDMRDLMMINTMADWFGAFCSSLSVWGPLTEDGRLLTGRNLDFHNTPTMRRMQVVEIRHAHGEDPSYIGVSWPGLVGAYTALSERGVSISMHDAKGRERVYVSGYTPRSLILREALRRAKPASFVHDIEEVFSDHSVFVGNNIHVSAPGEAHDPPAVVIEYDGRGWTVRKPTDDPPSRAIGETAIYCANHMCKRLAPVESERYEKLTADVGARIAASKTYDVDAMFAQMEQVKLATRVHTVVYEPSARAMHVLIPELNADPVRFSLREWKAKRHRSAGEPKTSEASAGG